jgi:allantoinase
MSGAPAKLAGLAERKGQIAPGFDADIIVFDPQKGVEKTTPASAGTHVTPYADTDLAGSVISTYVAGRPAFTA